ncbi:MAG TPA: ATP synthase F1 subunit epsilon [Acidimicrobiales bacterium]|nr:ATP synthase F1 subunit epsilon [Acidimicrobiales bacterium]
MATTFPTNLVTPERIVLEEDVAAIMLRTTLGDATYLAGHTPLVGAIVPGLVRFEQADGTLARVAVHGGFVHVKPEGVTVLAPVAELAGDIDVERARRALETAEQRVADAAGRTAGAGAGEDDPSATRELVEAQAALLRAQVRIEVAGTAT